MHASKRHRYLAAMLGLAGLAAALLVVPRLGASGTAPGEPPGPSPRAASVTPSDPPVSAATASTSPSPSEKLPTATVVAAGDVACDPSNPEFNGGRGGKGWCRARATARLIDALSPDAVLAVGDLQYDEGRLPAFRHSYDRSWGRFFAITRPAVGNHEYGVPGASGYFSYFGSKAGPAGKGWYSFDLGGWHLIALNSNCDLVACGAGSRQQTWLRADLASSTASCTLAYFHHPRFSSGPHGDDPLVAPIWRTLRRAGVDVIVNGHDHIYERFRPMNADGSFARRGIRSFTVGTGGAEHYWIDRVHRNSVVRNASTFGVLRLALGGGTYRWAFVPTANRTFTDRGWSRCQGTPTA